MRASAATVAAVLALANSRHALASSTPSPSGSAMPRMAQELFDASMTWMDGYYDQPAGYLYDFTAAAALRHETRSSAWYALGLLARNSQGGSDVVEAEKIITNIIAGQYKVESEQWQVGPSATQSEGQVLV